MSLKPYRKKRQFSHTSEPKGKVIKANEPIFVVQKHAASHLHYDFRLAIDGVLKSWAIPKGPCLDPAVKRLAIEVEDHPLSYATFEGTIPQGHYGAGEVIVWDYGHWQSADNLKKAYQKGSMLFTLQGHKLFGNWKLIRLKSNDRKPQWLLIKTKDKYSKKISTNDITVTEPASVFSKLTIVKKSEKIKTKIIKKLNPLQFKPELATLSAVLPTGDKWVYETKFDGYRILAFLNKHEVHLFSRNHLDWTHKFPTIVAALKKMNLSNTLLDGEMVILDKNKKSNFQSLQNYLNHRQIKGDLHYFVFDLPFYQGKDLTQLELLERKTILASKILNKKNSHIHYAEHLAGDPEKLLNAACKQGLKGIMAKVKYSTYRQKRTEDWLKLKCHQSQEFIVVGFTEPAGSRQYFGALLLANYDKNKKLVYCGHVGTGFTRDSLKDLYKKLMPLKQNKMPLAEKPLDPLARKVHWVKPKLVVEVEFTEWTEEGRLRHPSFQALRIDKTVTPALTHPEKIIYPAVKITKLDLAHYYEKICDKILPYIKDRPLSVVRCPEQGKCFYQKHWEPGMPNGLHKVNTSTEKDAKPYLTLNDTEGLLALAQLSVLEIHPWASHNDKLDYPDQLIFDLDPDTNLKWQTLIDATIIVHKTLENLALKSFIKLTGGKGLHVVVPIQRKQDFVQIKAFAKLLAEKLAKHFPAVFTANMSKKARTKKVFLDYLRNEREATAIAPFSPRNNVEASIAVPISWKKLPSFNTAKAYSIKTVDEYFKDFSKDPWDGFFKLKQAITKAHLVALQRL